MIPGKHYYDSIQRQSRCKDDVYALDTINAADLDETYGTYVGDECFDIHEYDVDTDHDTDDYTDDGTNDDTDDDTDVGGAGTCILSMFPAAVPGSLVRAVLSTWSLVFGLWSLVLSSLKRFGDTIRIAVGQRLPCLHQVLNLV